MTGPSDEELMSQGFRMVDVLARRLSRRLGGRVSVDDLRGLGNLAVVDLVRTYDPSRATFASYANVKLRYVIIDALRRETRTRLSARIVGVLASELFALAELDLGAEEEREQLDEMDDGAALDALLSGHAAALALGLASKPSAGSDDPPSPEEAVARAELGVVLRESVRELPERERDLLERHYFEGHNLDAIAAELGISKSWASRLHERAIRAMSARVKALM